MVFSLVICGHIVTWLLPYNYYITETNEIHCTGAITIVFGFRLTIIAWLFLSMYASLPADSIGLRGWFYSSPGIIETKLNRERYFLRTSDTFQTANFKNLLKFSSTINPSHFILENQIEMFNFSYLAYACGNKDYSQDFSHIHNMIGNKFYGLVDHIHEIENDTHCLIAQSNDKIIITFRGTKSWKNYKTDINAKRCEYSIINSNESLVDQNWWNKKYPWVHEGFYHAYKKVSKRVLESIENIHRNNPRPIYFTGHSLGGALATLCSMDAARKWGSNQITCTTFGSPRVGGNGFKKIYNSLVPASFRFVNAGDPICHTPIRTFWDPFTEVGTTVLLNDFGNMIINPNMLEYNMLNQGVSIESHRLTFYQLSLLLWCTRAHGRLFEPQFWPQSLQQLRARCGHIEEVSQYLSRSSLLGSHRISDEIRIESILSSLRIQLESITIRFGFFKRIIHCYAAHDAIEILVENEIVSSEAQALEIGRIILAKGKIKMVNSRVFHKNAHFIFIQK